MEQAPHNRNWFTRVLLILIIGFIAVMIGYKYFYVIPQADISGGLITLLSFLIILVLSEVFDNFSIGEIFKLSRVVKEKEKEVEKKEKEVAKVETEKKELISQLISISNNFSQKQSNTNIWGVSPEILSQVSVKPAESIETEELKIKEAQEDKKEEEKEEVLIPARTSVRRDIDYKKAEELALRKFIVENSLDFSKIFREVKIQAFQGIDPISDRSPIFDAYLNDIDKEIFFEVRPHRMSMGGILTERIYVMVSKIFHYRSVKKNNAYLQLILVQYANQELSSSGSSRLFDYFQAALNNNLLRIAVVKFTEAETDSVYED